MGKKLKIKVVYCGGWGYRPKFQNLVKELERIFPGQLEFEGEATKSTTGYFEVQVVDGPLLHSKKGGMGHVDNAAKLEKIVEGFRKALQDLEAQA